MANRPTLLGSCAAASSAQETRYRIDAAPATPRAARVVALDAGADDVVRPLLDERWPGARFLRRPAGRSPAGRSPQGDPDDLVLESSDGAAVRLREVLADADFVMMVATDGEGAHAASAIGLACTLRGIMTAGLVLGDDEVTGPALVALRPHARVLLVSRDAADVAEVLRAVGA
jgi:hypothetical protein